MAGRLFLDEVGDIPHAIAGQVASLPAGTHDRAHRRTQDNPGRRACRLCNASQPQSDDCTEQSFRDDLYYRLAEVTVNIPSLIERTGDAVLLAQSIL